MRELNEDFLCDAIRFERANWIFQRIGFAAMLLFIIAGLLGLLGGSGPVNSAVIRKGPLEVRYERFARWSTPSTIEIIYSGARGDWQIHLESTFADSIRIEQPNPSLNAIGVSDGWHHVQVPGPRLPGVAAKFAFTYTPDRAGFLPIRLRVGGEELAMTQLVIP